MPLRGVNLTKVSLLHPIEIVSKVTNTTSFRLNRFPCIVMAHFYAAI